MGCGASSPMPIGNLPNERSSLLPTSSTTLNQQSDLNQNPKRDRRRTDKNEIIQNFLLLWLDAKIDESNEDYRNSIKHLQRTVNTIKPYRDTEECINYISELENEKAFLIISGALCESVVPRVHNMTQLYSIYVFCRKKEKYEEWAKDWSKVKGIFTEIIPICDAVRQSARQCDEDSIVVNAVSSLNQIEPLFMYTQLFKEIILEIDFDGNKEINELAEYAREKYAGNDEHLAIIDEFVRDYRSHLDENNKPVWWYTRECFIYHMLNKALGKLQVETLLKMGIFIRDLHRNIEKLHAEQTNEMSDGTTKEITVYRGKAMTQEDFNKIKQGGLLSFNNFLSTSTDRTVAIRFIKEGLESNSKKTGVLFKMNIDQSISSSAAAPFASINKYSYFKTENEILFSMHTVFRVRQIEEKEHDGIKFWRVKLSLTNASDDQQLSTLIKRIRQEITSTGWRKMGTLLWKLGENNKAEQLYHMLLNEASNENDESYCYHCLGVIKGDLGQYNEAIKFYQKSLDIYEKTLPPNHPSLASSYGNIGNVYNNMGEYSKALSSHERALEIQKIALPPNHPDLAGSYINIGAVYNNMGEYSKALSSYERSLEIRKIALPPNHPDMAGSYQGIALVYDNMGEHSKALSSFERSLEIQKIALPPDHPNFAQSYNNIGLVYYNMGEYSKALSSFERSFEIQKIVLPPNHPDLASSYNNIGMVYNSMGEYSKALSSYERSLEIRKIALPPNHPDLASSYSNIGGVYNRMGEYSKALSSYERSLEMRKIALPPNHPDLASSYNNIGSVYDNMGEYPKALSSFERSLEIKKIALPPNHSDLATLYNNIGLVYYNMGEYSKALSSIERSLEIRKIALPSNHPDLATSYNNIGAVYNNMGEYSKALSSFERSLEIRKIALPPNHPDLAASYNNIGSVYDDMGEYSKALSSIERSLEIRKIALPPNHPDLASSYNNIGEVYNHMGEYSKALSSHERSLEIPRFLMLNVIDQLLEHYDQNHSKILIIGYLKLNINKFQSSSRKSQ
ncbi:unnamed protein product [Rotaria sordida]|uniref:NAD(P)(+)--arginine ADP-ribosyltransferase n=1 Tax=Rotaria sordida TaxID=392033 RepID=A0A814UU52_9BILA|nr:unnamed protein product [Rotaria sordida]CAF1440347.1 unnamed protein product [Rotaria sordida]